MGLDAWAITQPKIHANAVLPESVFTSMAGVETMNVLAPRSTVLLDARISVTRSCVRVSNDRVVGVRAIISSFSGISRYN
jgi:hypothetical protein